MLFFGLKMLKKLILVIQTWELKNQILQDVEVLEQDIIVLILVQEQKQDIGVVENGKTERIQSNRTRT